MDSYEKSLSGWEFDVTGGSSWTGCGGLVDLSQAEWTVVSGETGLVGGEGLVAITGWRVVRCSCRD